MRARATERACAPPASTSPARERRVAVSTSPERERRVAPVRSIGATTINTPTRQRLLDLAATLRRPLRELPDPLPLAPLPPGARFDVAITPPGSKSITSRALLLAALATGESTLRGALTDADDARAMIRSLRALGATIDADERTSAVRVRGGAGRFAPPGPSEARLDAGDSGVTARFLTAAAVLAARPVVVDGSARMRERPIRELTDALEALGARIDWLGRDGFPPLCISPIGAPGPRTNQVSLARTASGQYLSALLLIAPFLPGGLRLRVTGEVTSAPYVVMTLRMLRQVGVGVAWSEGCNDMHVEPLGAPGLRAFTLDVEPDASGAGPFWCAAALTPGARIVVPGLSALSAQGDVGVAHALERAGARPGVASDSIAVVGGPGAPHALDEDLRDIPDAAMALGALCCFADGPSTLRGLHTLRVKETDRLEALRAELGRVGARVEIIGAPGEEGLRIAPIPAPGPGAPAQPIVCETYNDHRMAMAMALVAMRVPGVAIRSPACVGKTYPGFWRAWGALYEAAAGGPVAR